MWYGGGLGYGKGVGIPSRAVSVVRQGSADTLRLNEPWQASNVTAAAAAADVPVIFIQLAQQLAERGHSRTALFHSAYMSLD